MDLPQISIALGGSVFLFVIILLVGVLVAFFFYHFTIPPLPPRRKHTLSVLRALALIVLLSFLFEPLLKLVFSEEQKPRLAILIDNSESMSIVDGTGDRSETVMTFLNTAPFGPFSRNGTISSYLFSGGLQAIDVRPGDVIPFTGQTTDIAAALEGLREIQTRENIQAAVLISDGVYTVGRNPLAVGEELRIPIYTIGVGDTTEQRDVLIANVTTNHVVYAETRVPVSIRVRSSGYKDERVEVTLEQARTVLDRTMIQLQEGTRDYTVTLYYEPKDVGVHRYTVNVSTLPGELTDKNNTASFFTRVLKTKLQILIIAGAPNPDVGAVRRILGREEHFSIRTFVQREPGVFYEGTLQRATIDSADCLVLIGFPSAAASLSHLEMVRDAVTEQRKPVLFVAAKTLDFSKLQLLENILPFSWSNPGTGEMYVLPSVPDRFRNHALVTFGGEMSADAWDRLPPVYKTQTAFRARADADVLASARVQTVALADPLILIRNSAQRKSLAITAHGIWRWKMLAQGTPQTESFFPLFLTNAVRWLTTLDEGKNVRVTPTKEFFTTAEPVEFTGQVYDEQYRPVDAVELRLEITSDGQRVQTLLRSIGSGRFEGSIDGLGAGEYDYVARATADGRSLGEDRGKFSIDQMNIEFLETRMNKELLEQLAYRTGGLFVPIAEAEQLIDSIMTRTSFSPRLRTHTSEIELWHWQYIGGFLILLLAVEWFLRKRSGML